MSDDWGEMDEEYWDEIDEDFLCDESYLSVADKAKIIFRTWLVEPSLLRDRPNLDMAQRIVSKSMRKHRYQVEEVDDILNGTIIKILEHGTLDFHRGETLSEEELDAKIRYTISFVSDNLVIDKLRRIRTKNQKTGIDVPVASLSFVTSLRSPFVNPSERLIDIKRCVERLENLTPDMFQYAMELYDTPKGVLEEMYGESQGKRNQYTDLVRLFVMEGDKL